jgi:hypothetical protein
MPLNFDPEERVPHQGHLDLGEVHVLQDRLRGRLVADAVQELCHAQDVVDAPVLSGPAGGLLPAVGKLREGAADARCDPTGNWRASECVFLRFRHAHNKGLLKYSKVVQFPILVCAEWRRRPALGASFLR